MAETFSRPSRAFQKPPMGRRRRGAGISVFMDLGQFALRKFGGEPGLELAERWAKCRRTMLWREFVDTLAPDERFVAARCVALADAG